MCLCSFSSLCETLLGKSEGVRSTFQLVYVFVIVSVCRSLIVENVDKGSVESGCEVCRGPAHQGEL